MIRYLPDVFSMPELLLCMALAAGAIAMIAQYFKGGRK